MTTSASSETQPRFVGLTILPMTDVSIRRIGVFYDGSYFTIASKHMAGQFGWLQVEPFQRLIKTYLREKEPDYTQHRVVYAAWFQGISDINHADEKQLRYDRRMHDELMRAGIEIRLMPISQSQSKEKGVDVALAIDALQVALDRKIDIAALVTGDSDFVPLVRALVKNNVRVLAAHFDQCYGDQQDFASQRLTDACDYVLNVSKLTTEKHYEAAFKGLFRPPDGSLPEQMQVANSYNTPAPTANRG